MTEMPLRGLLVNPYAARCIQQSRAPDILSIATYDLTLGLRDVVVVKKYVRSGGDEGEGSWLLYLLHHRVGGVRPCQAPTPTPTSPRTRSPDDYSKLRELYLRSAVLALTERFRSRTSEEVRDFAGLAPTGSE